MGTATQEITVMAPDISCGHCVATVEREVGGLPGAESVQASAGTKRVVVAFDPNRVSRSQVEATMDAAGYPVHAETA